VLFDAALFGGRGYQKFSELSPTLSSALHRLAVLTLAAQHHERASIVCSEHRSVKGQPLVSRLASVLGCYWCEEERKAKFREEVVILLNEISKKKKKKKKNYIAI